jgi:hypothetical protein
MKLARISFLATLTLVTLLIATKVNGQTHSFEQILSRADSVFRTQVTQDLVKYFHRDSTLVKYEFRRPHWRKFLNRHDEIRKGGKTKGKFESVLIFYNFHYKEPIINADLHKGWLTYTLFIKFDSNFKLASEEEDLSFIPKYLKEKRLCDFISMDSAIAIGKKANIKSGIEPVITTLDYDNSDLKRYCWWVTSPLTREKHGNHIHGEADTVTIDAVTGEVLSHNVTTYGAMH